MGQVANVIERGTLTRTIVRAALLWLLLRAMLSVATAGARAAGLAAAVDGGGDAGLTPRLAVLSSAIILAAVVAMARADSRALRENIFLANLGVSTTAITAITSATAGVLEVGWAFIT